MSSPSRQAQTLLDEIDAVEVRIAAYEAELRKLRRERHRLKSRLADTGYRVPLPEQLDASTALVPLWQFNLVGIRVERTLNWAKARADAAALITGAAYGGS